MHTSTVQCPAHPGAQPSSGASGPRARAAAASDCAWGGHAAGRAWGELTARLSHAVEEGESPVWEEMAVPLTRCLRSGVPPRPGTACLPGPSILESRRSGGNQEASRRGPGFLVGLLTHTAWMPFISLDLRFSVQRGVKTEFPSRPGEPLVGVRVALRSLGSRGPGAARPHSAGDFALVFGAIFALTHPLLLAPLSFPRWRPVASFARRFGFLRKEDLHFSVLIPQPGLRRADRMRGGQRTGVGGCSLQAFQT